MLIQKQANELSSNPPPDPDAAHRRDLTHQTVITIDDASTRDVDDGLAVEALPEGGHKLWVHIADPTRWVQQGDPLDLEAGSRGQTVYLPTGSLPARAVLCCAVLCCAVLCCAVLSDRLASTQMMHEMQGDGAMINGLYLLKLFLHGLFSLHQTWLRMAGHHSKSV